MSRIRSRQLESGSIPQRAIKRGGVSRDKLQPRVVGAEQLLPGSASRAIQGAQVTAEAQLSRETINYFSGIIIPLATEGWSAPAQDGGLPPDIEDLVFVEWENTQAVPGLSGMEEDELRLPATLINTVVNGYCNVVVSGKFASYTGQAFVEIWRWSQRHGDTEDDDLRQVWPPQVWPEAVTDGGRLYGEGHAIVVSEGDALGIRVIHNSESAQTLDIAVEIYAVSRYRLERNPGSPEFGPWYWWRGDDSGSLADDDPVATLPNARGFGANDVEVTEGSTPTYLSDAAGSQPGLVGGALTRVQSAATTNVIGPEGITILTVINIVDAGTPSTSVQVDDGSTTEYGFFVEPGFQVAYDPAGQTPLAFEAMAGLQVIQYRAGPDGVELRLNGATVTSKSGPAATDAVSVVQSGNFENPNGEIKIWGRALSDAELAAELASANTRYGL